MDFAIFCVFCGSDCTDNAHFICDTCLLLTGVSSDWVPQVCGSDVCYVNFDGEINLDGDNCNHREMFDVIADNTY